MALGDGWPGGVSSSACSASSDSSPSTFLPLITQVGNARTPASEHALSTGRPCKFGQQQFAAGVTKEEGEHAGARAQVSIEHWAHHVLCGTPMLLRQAPNRLLTRRQPSGKHSTYGKLCIASLPNVCFCSKQCEHQNAPYILAPPSFRRAARSSACLLDLVVMGAGCEHHSSESAAAASQTTAACSSSTPSPPDFANTPTRTHVVGQLSGSRGTGAVCKAKVEHCQAGDQRPGARGGCCSKAVQAHA